MSNVLINGRSAVHAASNGKVISLDVCLTQVGNAVVPIPYVNAAESKDADNTASTVIINGQPACHKDSIFSQSKGDEAGNKKGIKSGKIGAEASFIMGSANVLIEGKPAVRAMELMTSNATNTPPSPLLQAIGMPTLPAQVAPTEGPNALDEPFSVAVSHIGTGSNALQSAITQSEADVVSNLNCRPLNNQ